MRIFLEENRILELWKFTAKELTLKISYERIDELEAKLLT